MPRHITKLTVSSRFGQRIDHICPYIVSRALQTHNNVVMGVYFDVSMHTIDTNRPVHMYI